MTFFSRRRPLLSQPYTLYDVAPAYADQLTVIWLVGPDAIVTDATVPGTSSPPASTAVTCVGVGPRGQCPARRRRSERRGRNEGGAEDPAGGDARCVDLVHEVGRPFRRSRCSSRLSPCTARACRAAPATGRWAVLVLRAPRHRRGSAGRRAIASERDRDRRGGVAARRREGARTADLPAKLVEAEPRFLLRLRAVRLVGLGLHRGHEELRDPGKDDSDDREHHEHLREA